LMVTALAMFRTSNVKDSEAGQSARICRAT
jgi:hypothetical protein